MKKLGKVLITTIAVVVILYLVLCIIMNGWDMIRTKDYAGFSSMIFIGVWVSFRQIRLKKHDPLRNIKSWISLFSGLLLIKFGEYLFSKDPSDHAFCGFLFVILVLYVFSKRESLWAKTTNVIE